MKKIVISTIGLFILSFIVFTACKKEETTNETYTIEMNSDDATLEKQIKDFRTDMNSTLKSGQVMNVDDALWMIEAAFNYHYSFSDQSFSITENYTEKIGFDYNTSMSFFEIKEIYNDINRIISNNFLKCNFIEKHIIGIDLEVVNGELVVVTNIGEFECESLNKSWNPFTSSNYWYYGENLGKCGAYENTYIGQDAASKLESYAHLYFQPSNPTSYYYTDIVNYTDIDPEEYSNSNDNLHGDNYYEYLLFWNAAFDINYHSCLSPDEMNFYINGFETIMNDKKPTGKYFICCNFQDQRVIWWSGTILIHLLDLQFGIRHTRTTDPEDPQLGL